MKSNPFSTSQISPANCEFVFSTLINNAEAIQRLANQAVQAFVKTGCVQIIGPHGCGKSTLACQLVEHVRGRYSETRSLILRYSADNLGKAGQWFSPMTVQLADLRAIKNEKTQAAPAAQSTSRRNRKLLILDGIETLSWLNRHLLLRHFKKQATDVLLTTHRQMLGVPTLIRLQPDIAHFKSIVEQFQYGQPIQLQDSLVERTFHECQGDYREAIWKLYDAFESKARDTENATVASSVQP